MSLQGKAWTEFESLTLVCCVISIANSALQTKLDILLPNMWQLTAAIAISK